MTRTATVTMTEAQLYDSERINIALRSCNLLPTGGLLSGTITLTFVGGKITQAVLVDAKDPGNVVFDAPDTGAVIS